MLAKHAQIREELERAVPHRVRGQDARRRLPRKRLRKQRPKRAWLQTPQLRERRSKPRPRASAPRKASHDPVEKKTAREVFEYVIEQGRKEYQVQRYKGLGEMTAPQLWETTMDPDRRTLLQVKLEDIAACEEIFTTLMGEDVESPPKVHRRECTGCEESGYLTRHRSWREISTIYVDTHGYPCVSTFDLSYASDFEKESQWQRKFLS